MQYAFGSGTLYGVSNAQNATPVKFGALQDVSVEFAYTNKELYGQYSFPLAVGRGPGKVTGKAKFAQLNGATFNSLFFGVNSVVGKTETAVDEVNTIPGTPFQVSVGNAATFMDDLGVRHAQTGIALTKVASNPATGQYAVSANGVYSFAASDAAVSVLISYTYQVNGVGNKTLVMNTLIGLAPTFMLVLHIPFNDKTMNIKLFSCISTKLSLSTKVDDFVMPEFDFALSADGANRVWEITLDE